MNFRSKRINSFAKLSAEEARKKARILVIDDDKDAFPIDLFSNEGYNIAYWDSVKNLRSIEQGEYDIIILDIHGITEASKDGIGVLEHIKKYNPAQIVVAFSAKKYDLSKGVFWKLADDLIGKPSSGLECKQKIDALIEARFSAEHYWKTLDKILADAEIPQRQRAKLEKKIAKAADSGGNINSTDIEKALKTSGELIKISGVIANVILRVIAL